MVCIDATQNHQLIHTVILCIDEEKQSGLMADTLFIRWVNEENKTSKPLGFPSSCEEGKRRLFCNHFQSDWDVSFHFFTLEHFVGSFNTNRANHVWLLCDSGG
ncbi:Uncharacterised protein [Vibrio cholerae]|nr:Uncharacterised protein [Vibrio cholerae]CSA15916.1 Uncharacterised protein [Vibrio cholerae]CSA55981.1 Uncharacterised protein [Vibrio cholerae]CSC10658.1 Uncharacterised protein [Vibrio cholerae]